MINRFLNHYCTVVTKSTNSGPNRGFGKPNRTHHNSEPNRGYFKNRTEFRTEPEKVIPHTPSNYACKNRTQQNKINNATENKCKATSLAVSPIQL